ncbi:ATP-binding protein [Shewanella intestini]|uniref:histidine kinase n=1 Tax=Shewanella intestini TaxID=2017544 RepID=A0ABS5I108_9GAMM|nr:MULTISPECIES: ATP-binding protein [Shewanella]MBR9727702.1 GHKL domain-containing protein [Shewanella intestini]MRG35148.1 GHKL domain-containing protein [Shewanella sp. XMDDZSB0408]
MISIRSRLSLWLSALIVLATLLALMLFESMLREAFHDSIINRLEEDLERVILATRLDDGKLIIDQSQLSSFYKPAYSGRYYQLNLPNQVIRSRSLWDVQLHTEMLQAKEMRSWQAKGPQNNDIQLLSIGVGAPNSTLVATLTVAQDLSIGRRVFNEVFGVKLAINIGMLLSMLLGIFIILRQSFKPVNQVQTSIAKLRDGEISQLDLSPIPQEIRPLAETFNELLDYTSKQVERSRNNLGNLSHGLKTPLAVMQQQVEALGLTDPDLAMAMQQQLDDIRMLIERKLAAARVTGDMLPAAQMSVPKDFESLLNTLHKVHHNKSIQCQISNINEVSRVPIHREDGMELFGNLLDNAFKWAQSTVNVTIFTTEQHIMLVIEDDGAGVEEQALKHLTERGKRLDEGVMGHGLGLSIVKEICEQYGFTLTFLSGQSLSGLTVKIQLPLAHANGIN